MLTLSPAFRPAPETILHSVLVKALTAPLSCLAGSASRHRPSLAFGSTSQTTMSSSTTPGVCKEQAWRIEQSHRFLKSGSGSAESPCALTNVFLQHRRLPARPVPSLRIQSHNCTSQPLTWQRWSAHAFVHPHTPGVTCQASR